MTPSIDREALVEAAGMAFAQEIGWGTFSHFDPNDVRRTMRAVIPIVLEQAARVAEEYEAGRYAHPHTVRRRIAQAIRALSSSPGREG